MFRTCRRSPTSWVHRPSGSPAKSTLVPMARPMARPMAPTAMGPAAPSPRKGRPAPVSRGSNARHRVVAPAKVQGPTGPTGDRRREVLIATAPVVAIRRNLRVPAGGARRASQVPSSRGLVVIPPEARGVGDNPAAVRTLTPTLDIRVGRSKPPALVGAEAADRLSGWVTRGSLSAYSRGQGI